MIRRDHEACVRARAHPRRTERSQPPGAGGVAPGTTPSTPPAEGWGRSSGRRRNIRELCWGGREIQIDKEAGTVAISEKIAVDAAIAAVGHHRRGADGVRRPGDAGRRTAGDRLRQRRRRHGGTRRPRRRSRCGRRTSPRRGTRTTITPPRGRRSGTCRTISRESRRPDRLARRGAKRFFSKCAHACLLAERHRRV